MPAKVDYYLDPFCHMEAVYVDGHRFAYGSLEGEKSLRLEAIENSFKFTGITYEVTKHNWDYITNPQVRE